MKYRVQDGDVLDAICIAHYGSTDMIAAVLEANPGLAGKGAQIPSGTIITSPADSSAPTTATTRLWD